MKIVDKVKFTTRIAELLIIIATIVLTIISVNYANNWRGYNAMGGEYLIPVMGALIIYLIEERRRENGRINRK